MRAPLLTSMLLVWPPLLSVLALASTSREESIYDDLDKSGHATSIIHFTGQNLSSDVRYFRDVNPRRSCVADSDCHMVCEGRQHAVCSEPDAICRCEAKDFEVFYSDSQNSSTDCVVKLEMDILITCEEWREMIERYFPYSDTNLSSHGTYSRDRTRSHDGRARARARSHGRHKRTLAIFDTRFRWTDAVVPYFYKAGDFLQSSKNAIQSGINEISNYSCVTFVETSGNTYTNKVEIQSSDRCNSRVGMRGGTQTINLAPWCVWKGPVMHEFLHALGIWHEQSRPDRDSYVTIHLENLQSKTSARNFDKKPAEVFGMSYDYYSIMHYSKKAGSKNDLETIKTIDPRYRDDIGQIWRLSFKDVKTINLMYNCKPRDCGKTEAICGNGGFVGKDCQCYCPNTGIDLPQDSCPEINECSDQFLCGIHKCVDIKGGYYCRCNSGYVNINNRCLATSWITDQNTGKLYTVVNAKVTELGENVKVCLDIGGHLPEPRSAQENSFLASLNTQAFMLGINDEISEGNWVYQRDGSPVAYTNWMQWTKYRPEPDGGLSQNCAVMAKNIFSEYAGHEPSGWLDLSCHSTRLENVVCEKEVCSDSEKATCGVHSCVKNGATIKCVCSTGYTKVNDQCVDIDECEVTQPSCAGQTCVNTAGSFECGCPAGHTRVNNSCVDIDECAETPSICGGTSVCVNTEGSYTCQVSSGNKTGCNGDHTDGNGIFMSPNYPKNYDDNMDCMMSFKANDGEVIELNMDDFQLENHINCSYDYVTIYDGKSEDAPKLGTFCGTTKPKQVRSSGQFLFLVFHSDSSVTNKGFRGNYKSVKRGCKPKPKCGQIVNDKVKRIVGGNDTIIEKHPWQVHLRMYWSRSRYLPCGGAIIAKNWVLTAAHCTYGFKLSDIKVYAGINNPFDTKDTPYSVKNLIQHNFTYEDIKNDIALIEIDGEFDLTKATTRAVCLAEESDSTTFDEENCVVTGWGDTSHNGQNSKDLQEAYVIVANKTECYRVGEQNEVPGFDLVVDTHMCAGHLSGGIDSCQGDSGGPLVCSRPDGTKVVAGVVSFGEGCAWKDHYGYYTRVSYFAKWISNNMK